MMMLPGRLQTAKGVISRNSSEVVFAFVDEECRGMASPVQELDGAIFMTIGSNIEAGEKVRFKAWLDEPGRLVELSQTLPYQALGAAGTLQQPFLLSIEETALSSLVPDGGVAFIGEPYPNPAHGKVHLPYFLDKPAKVSLQVFRPGGQLLVSIHEKQKEPGHHLLTLDKGSLPKGMYFYRVTLSGKRTFTEKNGTLMVME